MLKKFIIMAVLAVFLATTTAAFAADVFVTENGAKYHKQECMTIKNKDAKKLEKDEAIEKGYLPCKRCYKEDVVIEEEK
ncbi:MAG: hypothetical protein P9X22_08515 [Candidatus Zapsychrus exili]|nr:hypothetical protein [Candidatus Zapsychrus exili]